MDNNTIANRSLRTFVVTLSCPGGVAQMEVPSLAATHEQGADRAGRRAMWTAIARGWGDCDEVEVTDVTLLAE
jgi:hypothetical protein